jgi:hypothetical protein
MRRWISRGPNSITLAYSFTSLLNTELSVEYRLLRSPDENESFYFENPDDFCRRVPIKAKKIVHRVITHPHATPETKLRVEELLRQYLRCRRRENSALEI